jgi:hypothetical protein
MRNFIGFILFGLVVSCSQNTQDKNKSNYALKEIQPMFEQEQEYENEIKSIESNKKLVEVTSLEYLSSKGETFLVKALVQNVNQEMTLKKLNFKQLYQNGNEITWSYYYKGLRKIASVCDQSIIKKDKFIKVITKSYYTDSSQVFFSKRLHGNSETIDEKNYAKCEPISHNDEQALKIINQKGEFETKFQGFAENMGKIYLILGTENFTSTVALSEFNPTLQLLKNNEKKFLGKKLIVEFFVNEDGGFKFQALKSVRFDQ